MFEKKQSLNTTNPVNSSGASNEPASVHSMPKKFLTNTQKTGHLSHSSNGKGKKLFLVLIALVLVIIIALAGIFFFYDPNFEIPSIQNTVVKNTNTNQNTNTNTNTNVNDNTNGNQNVNVNDNTNTNQNTNTNTNTNVNDNTNGNQNVNVNDNTSTQTAVDVDSDGLTLAEELIFDTSPNEEDTDQDGYKDGQEVISLYNPLLPAANIEFYGIVTRFTASNHGYSFLRPNSWVVKPVGSLNNLLILPDSETGESFTIDVSSNQASLSLEDFMTSMEDQLGSIAQYQNYSLAGQAAYRSINSRTVVVGANDYFLIIRYETASSGDINFPSIFNMMLNSWQWFDKSSPDEL